MTGAAGAETSDHVETQEGLVHGRFLIGADGPHSAMRKWAGAAALPW